MKYIYGPVPSRRLGQSLGIDTIPLKTCNWNCVYCQLGRTKPVIHTRADYIPSIDILVEVKQALAAHKPGEIDWVTFVGSGEPTLHVSIGELILQVKALTDIPVAVITNGSLLYQPQVQHDLAAADAVLPTLDAGTPELYKRINRPHPEATFERLVTGLADFRRQYSGQLWIEVMLIHGLNDTEQALRDNAKVLCRVKPDEIHISLPTRPPTETWVQPADEEGLMRALAILGEVAHVLHPAAGSFDVSGEENLADAVIGIITRHPMRQEELERTLEQAAPGQGDDVLAELEKSGRAQVVKRYGVRFWSAAPSHYPTEAQSTTADPRRRRRQK
ncbi:MAG: radical SAM protein [Anaerolineales bacterium]|nr:radical SAM protein [Anaerolineales bacterium]